MAGYPSACTLWEKITITFIEFCFKLVLAIVLKLREMVGKLGKVVCRMFLFPIWGLILHKAWQNTKGGYVLIQPTSRSIVIILFMHSQ